MATGKTHAKYIKVYLEDQGTAAVDVTASVDDISTVGLTYEESDVTAYSDGVRNFVLGQASAPITLSGPLNNTVDTGIAHVMLNGADGGLGDMSQTYTVTIQFGIRAAPSLATDPEFEGEYYYSGFTIDGGTRWTATFTPAVGTGAGTPAWGFVA